MKKVIIITRDGEYPINCEAYKKYSEVNNNERDSYIHCYIEKIIIECYDEYSDDRDLSDKHWTPLARKINLPLYNQIYNDENLIRYTEYANDTDNAIGSKDWFKDDFKIVNIIEEALKPKEVSPENKVDNKPYVNFEHNGFDVYFVFLNRIFDTFVNGSSEYGVLINDKNRLDFIKAIGKDCGLIDKNGNLTGERAILYIHDKEWYQAGKTYTSLQNGQYTKYAYPNEQQTELTKFFTTIKVFLHIESTFFNEIKSLNFTDN